LQSTGDNNTLLAGGGSELLTASGNNNRLQAMGGSDTLDGSASTGGNLFVTGTGAATITGGSGFDQFEVTHFGSGNGNISIDGGLGGNVAYMDGVNSTDGTLHTVGSVTTYTTGTQTITFNNVHDLIFKDTDYKT
jgi:hypothetical protein